MTQRSRQRFLLSLLNFLIAGIFGALMRYDFVREIPWMNYVHVESAHWHMALFGWIFLGMYSFITESFLIEADKGKKIYQTLFWEVEAMLALDAISEIAFGYNFVSIGLDLGLLALIGYFLKVFLGDLKNSPETFSKSFLKTALFFLSLSFCGIILLIPLEMLSGAKRSIFYYLNTQWFLHFNYNGWFTFSTIALFFRLLEFDSISVDQARFTRFRRIMTGAVFFTFFLSLYWGFPGHYAFLVVAATAALVQIGAVFYVRKDFMQVFRQLKPLVNPWSRALFEVALFSYMIKLLMQAAVAVPKIGSMPEISFLALTIRNYMIAYFHLMFLGVCSMFMLGFALQQQYIKAGGLGGIVSLLSFIIGFILLELLLVYQGTLLWMEKGFLSYYYVSVFVLTLLLPLGILLVLLPNLTNKKGSL